MDSIEYRNFYVSKVEIRLERLKRAIARKNVLFDIEQLKTEVNSDLKHVDEITLKLIENCSGKESDDVCDTVLAFQRDWEKNVDIFDKMKKKSFGQSNCLKWSFGYLGLGAKYNKWQILHQLITIAISIYCFATRSNVNNTRTGGYCDYWGYIDYDEIWQIGRGCYWSTVLLPPYYVLKYSCIASLGICFAIGTVDLICISKTVRKQIDFEAVLWFELLLASVLCLIWTIVIVSCAFSIKLMRHRRQVFDMDHLMEKYTQLTIGLSVVVIIAQRNERKNNGRKEQAWMQQRDFNITKIKNKIVRLKEAIDCKDVAFDIKQLRREVYEHLKRVEEVTNNLMMQSDKEELEGIGKMYLDVLKEVEFHLDSFDMMMQNKLKICLSNYFRSVIVYMQVAFSYNWWKIFSQVITVVAAIIYLIMDSRLRYWYGNFCNYRWYNYCPNWFTYLLPQESTFSLGSILSVALIFISWFVDLICASKAVRKRSENCVLCVDLTLAVIQFLIWLFLLVVSRSTWKEFRNESEKTRTLFLFVAMIVAGFAVLAQVSIVIVTVVKMVRGKLRKQKQPEAEEN